MLKKDGVETVYPSNRIRYLAKLNSNPLAWHFISVGSQSVFFAFLLDVDRVNVNWAAFAVAKRVLFLSFFFFCFFFEFSVLRVVHFPNPSAHLFLPTFSTAGT